MILPFVNSGFAEVHPAKDTQVNHVLSPLKQFKNGIKIEDIVCKKDFQLIVRSHNSPACVKTQSLAKMMERNVFGNKLKINNFDAELTYHLIGGNVKSADIFGKEPKECEGPGCHYIFTSDLKLSIEPPKKDSKLLISLPRVLIDSRAGESDADYFVLVNAMEVVSTDFSSSNSRVLIIDVPAGTQEIEIIGYGYYNDKLPQSE